MNLIPPSSRSQLIDELNQQATGIARDRVKDEINSEMARVESYDPINHEAQVQILRGGYGLLTVRVQTDYVGTKSGTGKATALNKNDIVRLEFVGGIRTGIYCSAEVVGQAFSEDYKKAPAFAPWQQSGKGTVTVHPRRGSVTTLGDAEFVDADSNRYATYIGERHVEDHGSDHTVAHGTNISEAEQSMREALDSMDMALTKFSLALG